MPACELRTESVLFHTESAYRVHAYTHDATQMFLKTLSAKVLSSGVILRSVFIICS